MVQNLLDIPCLTPPNPDAVIDNEDEVDRSRKELEMELLDYFARHTSAADTVEGIAQWWLRGPNYSLAQVQEVLNKLCEEGKVVRSVRHDGEIYYSLGESDA